MRGSGKSITIKNTIKGTVFDGVCCKCVECANVGTDFFVAYFCSFFFLIMFLIMFFLRGGEGKLFL